MNSAPELSPKNYPGDQPILQYLPQYHCPCCDGAIAGECVESSPVKPGNGLTLPRRLVRIGCDHCDEIFEARFVLVGGYYQLDGAVDVVTDARTRERMNARIEQIRRGRAALATA